MVTATKIVRSNLDMESYSLRNMYLSVFVVKTTYIYIGMMLAWTSPMIPHLETSLRISTLDKVAILACLPLGMALGPITGSVLAPRYGFKSIFLLFGCLSLTSVVFLAFRQVLVICVTRLAAGVAIGALLCYVEAYLHDISDQEVRTLLNPLTLVFLTLGFYLVYDVGQIILYFEMLLILLIVPVAFLICLTWLPESPYVDVAAGNLEKAKKSVDFLHRGISTRGLDQLMLLILEGVRRRESETEGHIFMPPFLKYPEASKLTLVFFTLLPLSGFPVVFMLLQPLITEAQEKVAVGSSLSAVARVDLCPIAVAWALNSYCSPKLKMITSSAIMALSMAVFGTFFFILESGQNVSEVSWLPLICMVLYTAAFLVGFAHKPDDGAADYRLRASGRVLALTSGFLSMFLVVLLFFPIKALLGTAPVLWTFSGFSCLLTILISIYSPVASLF